MRLESLTIDARDPDALATWWSEALGWTICFQEEGEVNLCGPVGADGVHPYPELSFVSVERPGSGQERIHLDLNSTSPADQRATVERLVAMGARPADVGQPADAPFVVLADPEGNRFCVLDPRPEYAHLGPVAAAVLAAHRRPGAAGPVGRGHRLDPAVTRDDPDGVVLTPADGGFPLEIITRPTMARERRQGPDPPGRGPRGRRGPGRVRPDWKDWAPTGPGEPRGDGSCRAGRPRGQRVLRAVPRD